jgi:hypothetical protein
LSRIVDLAVTKERFASIAGRPRPGDFRDASLILTGWKDCSLYGAATYTCDSAEMDIAEQAEEARRDILDQVKSCLGAGWAEAAERSSPSYVVLHNAARPVSITVSTDLLICWRNCRRTDTLFHITGSGPVPGVGGRETGRAPA